MGRHAAARVRGLFTRRGHGVPRGGGVRASGGGCDRRRRRCAARARLQRPLARRRRSHLPRRERSVVCAGDVRERRAPAARSGNRRAAARVRRRARMGRAGAARGVSLSAGAAGMIHIRPATLADAKRLAELRWEFRAGRTAPSETHDAFVRRCVAWMRRELQEGHAWRAWVAVSEGVIVGQVWLQTVTKIPNPVAESEQHAYLSNLYVTPDERGGVGTRL